MAVPARYWKISSSMGADWKRFLRATPLAVWGMALAHAGLGVTTIGITAVTAFQSNKILEMKVGQTVELAGATYRLDGIGSVQGPNYQADQARFTITSHSGSRTLVSERRLFPASQTTTTQAGIGTGFLGNVYVSIGEQNARGLVVRIWDHPLVDWIWAGGFLMVLGGATSLSDRRFRGRQPGPGAQRRRQGHSMKRLLFVVPVLAFVGLMAVFAFGLRYDPSHITSTLIDRPLPQFALPAVRDNQGLTTADFRGQPMLLNVFASWCVSCRLEHALLLQMKDQGVTINGLDWKDDAADGARYLASNGDPYSKAGNDKSGRTGIDLGVAGVPETFIVDGKGKVRYKFIGPLDASDYENTIKPLLTRLRSQS